MKKKCKGILVRSKRIALPLALIMCFVLLTACGEKGSTQDSPNDSRQSSVSNEKASDTDKNTIPSEDVEEQSGQNTSGEEETDINTDTDTGEDFLALLQEEYKTAFFQGETPNYTYYASDSFQLECRNFAYNGVIYLDGYDFDGNCYAYDTASKSLYADSHYETYSYGGRTIVNGSFYEGDNPITKFDWDGNELASYSFDDPISSWRCFDGGILVDSSQSEIDAKSFLLSYDLELIAEIPYPKDGHANIMFKQYFRADGTYCAIGRNDMIYRLDQEAYVWEEVGENPKLSGDPFCGKYISCSDGIYDRVTGEQMFPYGELYHAVPANYGYLCYFGGDKYLGYNNNDKEYRWVSLTDGSMSEPLSFPAEAYNFNILNDTYCIYRDIYGWFLYNYNDGTEEAIMLFGN